MSNNKTVEQFKERLVHLNTQLVDIEKNVTFKTDCLICDYHQEFANPLTQFNERLVQIRQTDWLKQSTEKRSLNHRIMNYIFPFKKEKLAK